MKVDSLMKGGDQWYPLYRGNECVGQLLIGTTFNEGAKYTAKIHKNWEPVGDVEDEEDYEEENYDMTQAMLMPSAGKVDPRGA